MRPTLPSGDLATAVASSVTKLKSDCAKREAMYLLRHTPLLHWVVASALREDRRRNAAEGRAHRVLVDLLSDGKNGALPPTPSPSVLTSPFLTCSLLYDPLPPTRTNH